MARAEDTTYSTFALVGRGGGEEPTIGRPVPRRAPTCSTDGCNPCRGGRAGELYLGGAGRRGAILPPELTAEKFVPDPFAPAPAGRLYRTGDLARYWPTGELEFWGASTIR